MNQQMIVEASDLEFARGVVAEASIGTGSTSLVEVLGELLTQSIRLRDLYRNARAKVVSDQLPDLRRVLDVHYQEQLKLIDMIVDRIRSLGGAVGVFASAFLQSGQLCRLLRGPRALNRMLGDFLEAHESVLSAAQPYHSNGDQQWMRDFAVGQVVLTNQQQCELITDMALKIEPHQKLRQTD